MRKWSKNNMPLGRLANAALRERKVQLHDALELLVAVKIRRDGVVDFNARGMKCFFSHRLI
ncbi:conserved hypothetical protein (plasmid) [Cupriavidus taiwanensis LMG 19424]|uniref:Uncharacterized protein n=3 Tax=Cupriavidus TaxID=106589 RepID=B2AJF4_CUPTR|nr:conserved hypothetical protein [Cupriavidus taiwanensis LMG 19424]SPD61911.1 conserved protein of unknown function [Cupriavidus taiwanensis]